MSYQQQHIWVDMERYTSPTQEDYTS